MNAFEKRIQALAKRVGNYRPYCPDCRNEQRMIVIADPLDEGDEPTVSGERCPTCGSPDAFVVHLIYEDVRPSQPGQPLTPRYAWDS